MKSEDDLHEYWRDPDDNVDQPERHLDLVDESEFLIDLIRPRTSTNDRVLEIGCNVGRNLQYLYEAGYRDLVGIEINKEALDILADSYPELDDIVELYSRPAEDVLKEAPDDWVDVTFTFALLAHIHPDNEFVFDEIVRTTSKYIVTFENEETLSYKQVPRDYEQVFDGRGCNQIDFVDSDEIAERTSQRPTYRARVFEVQ